LQPLMLPDGLQQMFRRHTVRVVQNMRHRELRPPGGIEIFRCRKHFLKFLRLLCVKVKPLVSF
jgi:hypothetical protein